MAQLIHLVAMTASIPSPPDDALRFGPLQLRAYGAVVGIGIVVAVWIAQQRWARAGGPGAGSAPDAGGDPEDVVSVVLWAVPAGMIGARIYHVLTYLDRYEGEWWRVVAIWQGGLGIFGGLAAGVVTGLWIARRRGLSLPHLLDAAAPALPVAQAIGRWGNWFNQELYGRPTDLPWALEIDPAYRLPEYADVSTFHPTFLYESLWNLTLAAALVWLGSIRKLRPGHLFAVYVAGYGLGRIMVESLRIDPSEVILGLRLNMWVWGAAAVGALVVVVADLIRPGDGRTGDGSGTSDDADPGGCGGSDDGDGTDEGEVIAEMEPSTTGLDSGPADLDP
jgi:prolipoprotein diacylglyceryl transferase